MRLLTATEVENIDNNTKITMVIGTTNEEPETYHGYVKHNFKDMDPNAYFDRAVCWTDGKTDDLHNIAECVFNKTAYVFIK